MIKRKRSRGVTILGYLLIFSSLGAMITLVSFNHYKYLFHHLPEEVMLVRYFISWTLRIVGRISGIGILRLSDICRKIAIAIFCITIMGVCVKNSYACFSNLIRLLDQLPIAGALGGPGIFSSVIRPAVITSRILDIIFSVCFIYFFTRPRVREQFKDG